MVMTGIRMGLRASDVINLKLTDIDWRQRSISIIQEKTKTPLTLPMPVYGVPKRNADRPVWGELCRRRREYKPLKIEIYDTPAGG